MECVMQKYRIDNGMKLSQQNGAAKHKKQQLCCNN